MYKDKTKRTPEGPLPAISAGAGPSVIVRDHVTIRPTALCASDRPICPRCGGIMHGNRIRYESIPNAMVVTCTHDMRLHTTPSRTCDQKAYIVGIPGRSCLVVPISRDEFEAIRRGDKESREVLRDLGVLVGAVREVNDAA